MDNINLDEFKVKDIIQEDSKEYNETIAYLSAILMDRSIPEKYKIDVRKQWEEVMRMKSITMKPPTIVLERKETDGTK